MPRNLPKGRKIVPPTMPPRQCQCGGYLLPTLRGKGVPTCSKCGAKEVSDCEDPRH